ncbi:MAG: hypothetical protein AUK44_04455 [Porphyromonadaceae bacterium CG2_30_38_12]|nr:MAG: hypothetical protein AUK44_04455 [Porphyromonadaceae bacterium CG2_30_38_12]
MKKITILLGLFFALSTAFSQDTVKVFTENLNLTDTVYKLSQGSVNAANPSYLYYIANNNSRLPVATSPVHKGLHSMNLRYVSKGTNWIGQIRLKNEGETFATVQDLTLYETLNIWFLSDRILTNAALLPKVALGPQTGGITNTLALNDYLTGVTQIKANTWYEVKIPLSDYVTNLSSFRDKVYKLEFSQNATSTDTVNLFVDDIVFTKSQISTDLIKKFNSQFLSISYKEGHLIFSNSVSKIDVYNLLGKNIYSKRNNTSNQIEMKLEKGIYIIATEKGIKKLITQ